MKIFSLGTVSAAAEEQLNAAKQTLAERETVAGELLRELRAEEYQQRATDTRLNSLRDDLRPPGYVIALGTEAAGIGRSPTNIPQATWALHLEL